MVSVLPFFLLNYFRDAYNIVTHYFPIAIGCRYFLGFPQD